MLHVLVKSFSLPKIENYYFDMMFIPSTGSQNVGDADPLGTISHDLHHAPLLSRLTLACVPITTCQCAHLSWESSVTAYAL